MSFVQRQLSFQFSLQTGSFGSSGGNSANLTGYRATVKIVNAGAPYQGTMSADIYGLPLSMMNQLTTYGQNPLSVIGGNTIIVQAGDTVSGMTTVWTGYINACFVNAQAQPEVSLHIESTGASLQAVTPVPPTSIQGSGDAATMIQQLTQQMGFQFENNGVNVKLANPYYSSSAWQQVVNIARHAGVQMVLDRGTVAIVPQGQARSSGGTPLISPQTGMVGYPAFFSGGIIVKVVFDPAQGIVPMGQISVQSQLTPANGTWQVYELEHDLETQVPHGEWFTICHCNVVSGTSPP